MEANHNSHASDLLELLECILLDAFSKCAADVSYQRDLCTIRSRVKDEGVSFLTMTLPQFCKDLERGLEQGFVDSNLFKRWKRQKGSVMPAFLQGITSHIFDLETGEVKCNERSPFNGDFVVGVSDLVESARQILLAFKKVGLACTPKREQAAIAEFIANEQFLETFSVPTEEHAQFLDVSSMLWGNLFADFQPADCIPKHGPGATSERVSGNQKYNWKFWHLRLEPYFPLIDNGYPLGVSVDLEALNGVQMVSEDDELPVRVVTVPKTLKAPRIIAIEPACMQYVQQGIRDYLYRTLESGGLTRGHINFRDQSINRSLALDSSATGRLATIDLSDASDRVPHDLAMEMFSWAPDLKDSIEACRSRSAKLPTGEVLPHLMKFASMGSALCFPVEAMYFYTCCVIALLKDNDLTASYANIFKVSRDLYVYGDDIAVPATNAASVVLTLQKYNCKVNASKSFWTGKFRESCGMDAYDGQPVTPVYVRETRPTSRQQARKTLSWNASANLFYLKGYWKTAQFMRDKLELLLGVLPIVDPSCSGLGRNSFLRLRSFNSWNADLQRLEVRCWVAKSIRRTDRLRGYGAVMKFFIASSARDSCLEFLHGRSENPILENEFDDPQLYIGKRVLDTSLTHTVLRGAITLKRRGVPVMPG